MAIGVRNIDGAAIREAIGRQPAQFQTKDISEAPSVRAAHAGLTEEYMYHAVIGRYISMNKRALGVESGGKGAGGRGEIWRKVAS